MDLDKQIEALLFYKGEPVTIKRLAKLLSTKTKEVESALSVLEERLQSSGITLQRKDDSVTLGTHPELSDLMVAIRKEELSRDIGKAGLETLSIILYKGEVARSEIDYIRGVNSSFILRNLLIRGLVERITNPSDSRSYLYKPTFQLMSFLGITKIEDLPQFEEVQQQLEAFMQEREVQDTESDNPFAENITQT